MKKKLEVKDLSNIIETLMINAPKATGNVWLIDLDDIDFLDVLDWFKLWKKEEDYYIVAGNKIKFIFDGITL